MFNEDKFPHWQKNSFIKKTYAKYLDIIIEDKTRKNEFKVVSDLCADLLQLYSEEDKWPIDMLPRFRYQILRVGSLVGEKQDIYTCSALLKDLDSAYKVLAPKFAKSKTIERQSIIAKDMAYICYCRASLNYDLGVVSKNKDDKAGFLEKAITNVNEALGFCSYISGENELLSLKELYYLRGISHFYSGMITEAERDISRALQFDPRDTGSLEILYRINMSKKNYSSALANVNTLIRVMLSEKSYKNPGCKERILNPSFLLMRARSYIGLGRNMDATVDIITASVGGASKRECSKYFILLLKEVGGCSKYISQLQEYIDNTSQQDDIWHFILSNLCLLWGNPSRAMDMINEAINCAPNNSEYYSFRAIISINIATKDKTLTYKEAEKLVESAESDLKYIGIFDDKPKNNGSFVPNIG